MSNNPLGKPSRYTDRYAPQLLHAVPRAEGRKTLGLDTSLPFHGSDVWNAWEVSWLDVGGRPVVATMTLSVPCDTPALIESKSLKLYLNSLAMSEYVSQKDVARTVAADLTRVAGAPVEVELRPAAMHATGRITKLPGRCIDYESVDCDCYTLDATLLKTGVNTVSESLHSHVLRSLCPVTGQPDIGSLLITYHGPRIDAGSLLRYLTSYRQHNDFHETCAERIFCDLKTHCGSEQLSVHARFNRRGGIDINPFRSDFEDAPPRIRLWRQ